MLIFMKYLLVFTLILSAALNARAQRFQEHFQEPERNKGKAFLSHFGFGLGLPGADLAKRFGLAGNAGIGIDFITANNWIVGCESFLLFGSSLKEDPLSILRLPDGTIIGKDMLLADVALRERGLYVGGRVGRLFATEKRRSGLRLTLGAGVLRHRIRVQDNTQTVAQLTGDYTKGYDRLTSGPALNQFIGWQQLSKNRRNNWIIGLEFNQGFTNTLRDWDFSTQRKLDAPRVDLQFNLRVAWTLPLYLAKAEEIFY